MADRQGTGKLRAFELGAQLRIGIVEDQLVIAGTAELLALVAGERRRMIMALRRPAVPGRTVAAAQIALSAGVHIDGAIED